VRHGTILTVRTIADKIQDGGRRHIEIHILGHNLVNIPHISTEFDTEAENRVPQPDLPSKFTFAKLQNGVRAPSWNQLNGCNSAIFERICTKLTRQVEQLVGYSVITGLSFTGMRAGVTELYCSTT